MIGRQRTHEALSSTVIPVLACPGACSEGHRDPTCRLLGREWMAGYRGQPPVAVGRKRRQPYCAEFPWRGSCADLPFRNAAQYAIAIAPYGDRPMSNTTRRAGRHFLQIPGPTPL